METNIKINWACYQQRIWEFLNSKNSDNFNDKLEVLHKDNDDFFSEEEKKKLNEEKAPNLISTSAWNLWEHAKDSWKGYNCD